MKKTLIILSLFLVFVTSAFSQNKFTFEGVPFGVSLEDSKSSFEKAGFRVVRSGFRGEIFFSGTFCGFSNCSVRAFSKGGNVLSGVSVSLPTCGSWNCLYTNYTEIITRLKQKFGMPTVSKETFWGDQKPGTDYEKLNEVTSGQCVYSSTFSMSQGTIQAYINSDKSVVVCYTAK